MPIARGGGKDVAHTHTMEYYSAAKKNAVMTFVATWMDLGRSLMSHWVKSVRRRRRNTFWHPLYVESKKKWYNWSYRVETHRLGEWTGGCWGWGDRMGGRDSEGVWDQHVHTAICKMENPQRPTVWHRELCSMLFGSLDGRGVWGKMDTCMWMAESLCCSPETLPASLINYDPTQNKMFFKKEKKKWLEIILLNIIRSIEEVLCVWHCLDT